MIIYTVNGKKTYETNSMYPSSDWTGRAEHIIDETKEENAELVDKVRRYAPYFEIIANSTGEIHDIVKTADKPQQTEPEGAASMEQRIAQLEAQIAEMKNAIAESKEAQA